MARWEVESGEHPETRRPAIFVYSPMNNKGILSQKKSVRQGQTPEVVL